MAALASSRIPVLREHVRDALVGGDPLVVFSAHRAPIQALSDFPRSAIVTGDVASRERDRAVQDFQGGAIDLIAGTIQAMGTGLTLTRAARVVLADEAWTPALNEQAVGRLLRHGQDRSVLVERLVSDHPLDLRRREVLGKKTSLISVVVG